MAPTTCFNCKEARAVIIRPKNRHKLCRACFIEVFETEVHETITGTNLFFPGERIAIGASGGKDSTVLAAVLKTLNERYNYGLDLCLLSIDEGIRGYRDDSLETVKRNAKQYDMPLTIVGYGELYGWTMDQVVEQIGKKGKLHILWRALDRGAARLDIQHVVTGHNADDVAETVMMNLLRGDLPRLSRGTSIVTASGGSDIKRSKPLKYAYEKEIVLYAHHRQLDYFTTECIYSPRHSAAVPIRPSSILDIVKSGEDMAALVPRDTSQDGKSCKTTAAAEEENTGSCGSQNGRTSGGEMAAMEKQLTENETAEAHETEIQLPRKGAKNTKNTVKSSKAVKSQTLGHCERCGYISSQRVCKACTLLEGLNRNRPKTAIEVGMEDEEGSSTLMRQMERTQLTNS
ncbi:Cytoplasmic tRNA 2-thiolation protein 1 [Penicillium cosmopolitanum]|uniref:Cytoplasmic tRNA 2-thiolation protein 1 n=1 Tax=Penicillium cosmopolitanum TaxID=1131564 RepID=A0A9X0BBG4_9EURO|nr:Cytoplasmic tRNA 2-thiolation protein 1 [Penicillium cosmopolitanum]KAJ5403529.1 Cytoplasmic tRNA 2-thiolation protein 1 [Penicillium cosmopolitanum]